MTGYVWLARSRHGGRLAVLAWTQTLREGYARGYDLICRADGDDLGDCPCWWTWERMMKKTRTVWQRTQ